MSRRENDLVELDRLLREVAAKAGLCGLDKTERALHELRSGPLTTCELTAAFYKVECGERW